MHRELHVHADALETCVRLKLSAGSFFISSVWKKKKTEEIAFFCLYKIIFSCFEARSQNC
jgi:hypothetical protein